MARVGLKTIVRRIALVAGLVVGAGYASNLVTRPWCERDLMRAAVMDMSGVDAGLVPVYVFADTAARTERALHRLGVSTVRCNPSDQDTGFFNCFPWAGVDSRIGIPYIIVARWEYVAFPTSGHGRITTFFCLFGLRVPVAERGLWVS